MHFFIFVPNPYSNDTLCDVLSRLLSRTRRYLINEDIAQFFCYEIKIVSMRRLLGKLVSFTKQKVEKIDEIIPSALAPKLKK